MAPDVVARTLKVLASSKDVSNVDITGGAPELNPSFRRLVMEVHKLGCHIVDRCNLTVLSEPGMEKVLEFLAEYRVEICASLPCYTADNVERQRGPGTFAKSIDAIRLLNALGYGMPNSDLRLNLVYNPPGSFLPPPQEELEDEYRQQLLRRYGIAFHRFFTITNMPIGRFATSLCQSGRFEAYMALLVNHFNPSTLSNLMCRSLVSVGYDGRLYDCDFNQMLGIGIGAGEKSVWTIRSFADVEGERIFTGRHCFGCTAGCGSSCEGSLQ
jgi:radical SAM/Cys-rich protein